MAHLEVSTTFVRTTVLRGLADTALNGLDACLSDTMGGYCGAHESSLAPQEDLIGKRDAGNAGQLHTIRSVREVPCWRLTHRLAEHGYEPACVFVSQV